MEDEWPIIHHCCGVFVFRLLLWEALFIFCGLFLGWIFGDEVDESDEFFVGFVLCV